MKTQQLRKLILTTEGKRFGKYQIGGALKTFTNELGSSMAGVSPDATLFYFLLGQPLGKELYKEWLSDLSNTEGQFDISTKEGAVEAYSAALNTFFKKYPDLLSQFNATAVPAREAADYISSYVGSKGFNDRSAAAGVSYTLRFPINVSVIPLLNQEDSLIVLLPGPARGLVDPANYRGFVGLQNPRVPVDIQAAYEAAAYMPTAYSAPSISMGGQPSFVKSPDGNYGIPSEWEETLNNGNNSDNDYMQLMDYYRQLQQLRYALYKAGIHDARDGSMITEEQLKQFMQHPLSKNLPFLLNRSILNILNSLNTVAQTPVSTDVQYAKFGKKLNYTQFFK